MERGDRALATVLVDGELASGARIALDGDALQHLRVRRNAAGDRVRVLDGRGLVGEGQLEGDRRGMSVVLDDVRALPRAPELRLYLPVADRDRMLWLAEKCVEFGVSSWHPVMFARSRSVSPRGEGDAFDRKLHARVRAALEQSGGGWLPDIHPVVTLDAVLADASALRLVFDAEGTPGIPVAPSAPVAALVGPEGGLEPGELAQLVAGGWRPTRLAGHTLRFETAGIAAVAVLRQSLTDSGHPAHG